MLERLQIKNFQKHALLRIKFDPAITTITGPSDAGKSAIIRALRWLCFNKPGGTAHIRHGEEVCSVTLQVDGKRIKRTRGKGNSNSYSINGKAFKAFGDKVPDEVVALLGVTDLNFQRQHDAPYWFSDTPGQVSKSLNAIVDLGVIDDVLAELAAAHRMAAAAINITQGQLKEVKQEAADLDWVPEANKAWAAVQTQAQQAAQQAQQAARLRGAVQRAGAARRALKGAKAAATAGVHAVTLAKVALDNQNQLIRLRILIKDVKHARQSKAAFIDKAKAVKAKLHEEMKGVCPICQSPLPS